MELVSAPLAPSSMLGPVTLYDGSIVDPSTIATLEQCIPGQCGWGDLNYKLWCASSGQVGNRTCKDPACAPFCPSQSVFSIPPQISNPVAPAAMPVALTPQNIVQPLPDIVAVVAPLPIPQPVSIWCELNAAITNNPLLAVAALAGVAFLLWRKK